jgi:hypothetical protein
MSIKKTIILFLFFLSFHFNLYCQGFSPGIFGGILGSQVDGDRLSGFNKPGGTFGILISRNISKAGYIQTEFEFIQKGSRKVAHPDQGDINSYEIKLNYIEFPVLFKYSIKNKFIPEAGLGFAYLINSAEIIDEYSQTPVPEFNSFEYSYIFGFNYKVFDKFCLNIRFSQSILPIRKLIGDKTIYFDGAQYNKLLSFSIYYYFFKNN